MKENTQITTINGPVIEGYMLQPQTSGVIYSVSLANGMVVTSPEGFEVVTNGVNHSHRYRPHEKPHECLHGVTPQFGLQRRD